MNYAKFSTEDVILGRATHDDDLIEFITELAKEENVEVGFFTAIGALKRAKLGFYDQDVHEYREMDIDFPCEIASCLGNISERNQEIFVHAHAVITDETGRAMGGHLKEGKVFASEVYMQELKGPRLVREHDDTTDLDLWQL